MPLCRQVPKILYIEDEKNTQDELSVVLKRFCQNLYFANDGLKGLESYKKYKPQIIITDIQMPKLNGIDMLKKIREIDEDVKIIILTAFNNNDYLLDAIRLNVYRYIQKPIDLDILEKKLLNIIDEINIKNELLEEKELNTQLNTISHLSSGISHEINTPLTIISGTLDMLKMSIGDLTNSKDKDLMLEDISTIEQNLNRIKNITESFREISDTENISFEKVNLYRVLIYVLRLTYNKAKNITKIKIQDEVFNLDIDRDKKEFFVNGNYKKLEYALIAIIENALDQFETNVTYEKNLIDIEIQDNDGFFTLNIIDNGGGIEPSLIDSLYKPFQTKKQHKGFGIGLPIVKKILDEHYFHINISNTKDGVKVSIICNKE